MTATTHTTDTPAHACAAAPRHARPRPARPRAQADPGRDLAGRLLNTAEPFALISRGGSLEFLSGEIVDVETLADIPLHDAAGTPQHVVALVPYRQIAERGYTVRDDDSPLRCLIARERITAPDSLVDSLPAAPAELTGGRFTTSDAEYERIVRRVIDDEIGTGQGANFVIRRDFTARFAGPDRLASLGFFRALLEHERGAYWTFCIVAGDVVLVGASPEAHVRVESGIVTMNPISGTLRHVPGHSPAQHAGALLDFLANQKETEELFMVVDEEMKMMSAVCPDGGKISGPFLKPMSRLTHTEYELHGSTSLPPTDVLRETMFAPTVTGSPMRSACTVIARHEDSPRGYYSGVAALFTPDEAGGHNLDAPILIRTARLADGELRISAGATLVRHSDPAGEAAETAAKVSGVLSALGVEPMVAPPVARSGVAAPGPDGAGAAAGHADPGANRLLAARNSRLSAFWLHEQRGPASTPGNRPATGRPDGPAGAARRPFSGNSALVVDAEDRFTTMLAHQLRNLGLAVTVRTWDAVTDAQIADAQLLVAGPGPGDPAASGDPRIARMAQIVRARLAAGAPLLAVCLSHQVLARELGLALCALEAPRQGLQLSVPVFGAEPLIGFYNTFTARVSPGTIHAGGAEVAADPDTGDVFALRGTGFASVQGHLESVLSRDGLTTLTRMVAHALA